MKTYTPTEMERAVPIRVRSAVRARVDLAAMVRLAMWCAR